MGLAALARLMFLFWLLCAALAQQMSTAVFPAVTTELSFSYTPTTGTDLSECLTTEAVVSTDGFEVRVTNWISTEYDEATSATSYKIFYFVNFAEEYTDVGAVTMAFVKSYDYAVLEQPQMVSNPNEGFYFTMSTDYNNTLGTDIVIVVAKNNKFYLFQDCLSGTNVASKHIGGLYTLVCVNVPIAHYYDPQVDGTNCELDGMKTIEFGPFQDTPSSQRYSIETSTTQSGTTIDSRTLSTGSSISLEQSTTTESISQLPTRPTFRYTTTQLTNELKTDFTIVTLPSVTPTTTRPHSSVEQSTIVTAPIFATKGSQTGASADPSATSLTPIWTIDIPGYLGPWAFLTVDITKGGTQGTFEYTSAEILLNGVLVSSAIIQVTSDSISLEFDTPVGVDDDLVIQFGATVTGSGATWVSMAHIVLHLPNSKRLAKRSEKVFDVSFLITVPVSVSSSASASASAAVSFDSAFATSLAGSTNSSPFPSVSVSFTSVPSFFAGYNSSSSIVSTSSTLSDIRITSTAAGSSITHEQSTTVFTMTSCSDSICATTPITTGVTVVTTTESNSVITYTTYCPLASISVSTGGSTITASAAPAASPVSTTVISVISCKDNKCSEVPITTGVMRITSTSAGVVTTYTTYCPLTSHVSTTTSESIESSQGTTEIFASANVVVSSYYPSSSVTHTSAQLMLLSEGGASRVAVSVVLLLLLSFLM